MTTTAVTYLDTHVEYQNAKQQWRLVRDLMQGESALKRHDLQGVTKLNSQTIESLLKNNHLLTERYLPVPDASNCDAENLLRYCQYVQRASLFNATKRTEVGLAGMVFSKPGITNLPPGIEFLGSDADGTSVGLEQQAREVVNDVLETGRDGLLVDFPAGQRPTTAEEKERQGIHSTINIYKAEAILDWDTKRIGAQEVLSYVKLREVESVRDAGSISAADDKCIIRVLYLDENNLYAIKIIEDGAAEDTATVLKPTNAAGARFDYIPFYFVGAVNNRPNVDAAPLIELAEVNLGHYRNSADFEESAFVVGQPTPVVNGLTQAWIDKNYADGMYFGSLTALFLPQDADAKLLQAQPNTMPENGMQRKEKQMIELGARLITEGGQAQTAEAARIKHAGDASALAVVVTNVNQAYADAIQAVKEFEGETGDAEFTINTDFFAGKLSPDEVRSLVEAWQMGAISKDVLDRRLQNGGVIGEEIDLEEMNEAIRNTPTGVNFDDNDDDIDDT